MSVYRGLQDKPASLTWDEVMVAVGRLSERLTAVEREQAALRETLDGLLGAGPPSTLPATPHWPGTGPQRATWADAQDPPKPQPHMWTEHY